MMMMMMVDVLKCIRRHEQVYRRKKFVYNLAEVYEKPKE